MEPNIFRMLFSVKNQKIWCCKPPVPLVGQKNPFWLNLFKINLKWYVYFSFLYNFIFSDILLSRSQIFIDGCNPKDNIEKYVKNNIDNLSKMVPSYCSCLHKRNWKKLFFDLSKSENLRLFWRVLRNPPHGLDVY